MFRALDAVHEVVTSLAASHRLKDKNLEGLVVIEELGVVVPREIAELLNDQVVSILRDGQQVYQDLKKVGGI